MRARAPVEWTLQDLIQRWGDVTPRTAKDRARRDGFPPPFKTGPDRWRRLLVESWEYQHGIGGGRGRLRRGRGLYGRYRPLFEYLRAVPKGRQRLVMSFDEVERVLGGRGSLPPSALRRKSRWWANRAEAAAGVVAAHQRAWRDAGWRVVEVEPQLLRKSPKGSLVGERGRVTFRRKSPRGPGGVDPLDRPIMVRKKRTA